MLVVEDERRLAAAVKRGLEASGFVVDLAFDGLSGLHMAGEGGYDGVVLVIAFAAADLLLFKRAAGLADPLGRRHGPAGRGRGHGADRRQPAA